jgi:transcriptional regulator with XRE-family HTH domain
MKNPTSGAIVRYLIDNGYTQAELGKIIGVGHSYISHVLHGKRNLTLNHLEALAANQRMSLPELYLKAVPVEDLPDDLQEGYRLYLKVLSIQPKPVVDAKENMAV